MRPDPTSSPSTVTSADRAEANGAIRWGAGISSTKSSDRNFAALICVTARLNSGGADGGSMRGCSGAAMSTG